MKKNKKLTIIDLFCGAGGLSKGFEMAGFEILLGIDSIPIFTDTFSFNHKKSNVITGDIRNISVEEIKKAVKNKKINVIIGGPPCQGFSIAGKRDRRDPRNSLFMEFIRIVNGLKPDFFVMENVKGMLSMKTADNTKVIDIILKEFRKIGYKTDCKILNSCNYGVPQTRQRIIFIGAKSDRNINFPSPTHFKIPFSAKSGEKIKKWVSVGEVLLKKENVDAKFFHSKKMIDGFNKRKIKNKEKGNGFGAQYLKIDKPSYTISARYYKDGADALVKYNENEIRMLTPLECAKIQSFPNNFIFKGNSREQYTQIGNAVPPLLAKAVAEEIKKMIR